MNTIVFASLVFFIYYLLIRVETYTLPEKVLTEDEIDLSDYVEEEEVSITHDLMQEIILRTNEKISKKTGMCTYIIETTAIKKFVHKENGKIVYRCMFMTVKYGNPGFDFGFLVSVDVDVINEGPRFEELDVDKEFFGGEGRQTSDIMEETKRDIEERMANIDELNEIEQIRLRRDYKKMKQLEKNLKTKIDEKPKVSIMSMRTQPIYTDKPNNIDVFVRPTKSQEFVDYNLVRDSELDFIKGRNFIEKQIMSSEEMYGKKNEKIL